jgi:tartrate dehydratase alpha subunit/fumarate hydratase class I-like protein
MCVRSSSARKSPAHCGTRDLVEPVAAHRRVAAEIASQWNEFGKGVQELSHKQTMALAGEVYRGHCHAATGLLILWPRGSQ